MDKLGELRSDREKFDEFPKLGELLHLHGNDDKSLDAEFWSKFADLGGNPEPIRDAFDEFDRLDQKTLELVFALLFAHPQWSAGEAAASVISSLANPSDERGKRIAELIRQLWKSENRRVRFASVEAAFGVRYLDGGELFKDAVLTLYNDRDCRVRGLCAENLTSCVLTGGLGGEEPAKLLEGDFSVCWTEWFSKDRSCWLADQLYWLASGLYNAKEQEGCGDHLREAWEVLEKHLNVWARSPLFDPLTYMDEANLPSVDGIHWKEWENGWYRFECRETFLRGIEAIQRQLLHLGHRLQDPEIESRVTGAKHVV